ncbi:helix-turn-helix transcriptional regulator [Lutibacter sp. A80]|uniref:helix-turn-helix transcriptional regulator n=1 Tax=Lutibacter sp. A80 TaxID=2918453 RepID=UPI001F06485F|nr:helix-turn-helix transcriptional regulator [Lutibacter sp. A80]UMB61161.1 helix-turn-helix transcriptional regulator [Lutibacter sp. A80]
MGGFELKNQIKVQRAIKNITQAELAAEIGVTRKTINTIETGKFVPSTILAIRLARFFNINVEELFELIEE